LYSMVLARIFPAKSYGMFKNEKRSRTAPITFVFLALWEPIIS
jgi:hypothetical protein